MNMAGLGESLKNEREKRGITLEDVAKKTNINIKALQALELNDFKRIPGAFYFKNYIKNYLAALDIPAEAFLETHQQVMESAFTGCMPDSYCAKVKYARFKKRSIYFSILVTAFLIIGVSYIIYSNKDDIFGGWTVGSDRVDIPESMMRLDFIGQEDNYSIDYPPVQAVIEFKQNCWAQVFRGKEKIADSIFQQGSHLDVSGYELTISIGNPAGVRFLLNGREVTYLKNLNKAERLVINPATALEILKKI